MTEQQIDKLVEGQLIVIERYDGLRKIYDDVVIFKRTSVVESRKAYQYYGSFICYEHIRQPSAEDLIRVIDDMTKHYANDITKMTNAFKLSLHD